MNTTSPIAFVYSGNNTYHIYVSRQPDGKPILGQLTQTVPNDYTGTILEDLFPVEEQLIYESLFSTSHYHEISVVDAIVELCFEHRISSIFWEGTKTAFNPKWVFYSPKKNRIIDYLRAETGHTHYTDRSFVQLRNDYPDLIVVPVAFAEEHKLDACLADASLFSENLDAPGLDVNAIPSSEAKAKLYKTARLASHTITAMIRNQENAQYRTRLKYDQQSLSTKCFGAQFQRLQLNIATGRMEPVFNLRESDGSFFGYLFEKDLLLCL